MPLHISNVLFLVPSVADVVTLDCFGFCAALCDGVTLPPDSANFGRVVVFPTLGADGEMWASEIDERLLQQGIPERIRTLRVSDFTPCIPKDEGLGVDCLISTFCGNGESDLIGDIYAAAVGD